MGPFESAHDNAVFICSCGFMSLSITLAIPTAGSFLFHLWRSFSAHMKWPSRGAGNSSTEILKLHLAKKRMHFMRQVLAVMEATMFALFLAAVISIGSDRPRSNSPLQETTMLIAYFSIIVLRHVPRALPIVGAYGVYVLGVGLMITYAGSADTGTTQWTTLRYPRLICAVAVLNIPLAIASNVLHLMLCNWFHLSAGTVTGVTVVVIPRGVLLSEFVTLVLIVSVVCMFMKIIKNEIAKELEAKAARTEQSAVFCLLETICDLVAECDHDLRLVEHFPRLAATLMLDSGRSLKGARLQEFMPMAEDQQEFQRRLLTPQPQQCRRADAFHVTLRDSGSSNIRMELFTVQFTELSGSHRHLIGMREFTDVLPLVSYPAVDVGADGVTSCFRESNYGGGNSNLRRRSAPRAEPFSRAHASGGGAAASDDGGASSAEHGGTPPESPRFDLAAHEPSSPRSSRSSKNISGGRLQLGHLRETSRVAKEFSLLRVMSCWNVRMARAACCPMHETLGNMFDVVKSMRRIPCRSDFVPEEHEQCQTCGILDMTLLPGHERGICVEIYLNSGGDPSAPRASPSQHEDSSRQAITL